MKVRELIHVLETMPRYNGMDPQECEVMIPDYFEGLLPVESILIQENHGMELVQNTKVIVVLE